jgi:hypothetical protein
VLNGDVYVAQLRDCEQFHSDVEGAGADLGTEITLQLSTDAGKTFKRTCFPVSLSEKGYTLFDFHTDKGGPDFISVDHDEEDAREAASPMGNLYTSDESLQLYTLSMRRNVRFGGAAVDFANVEGIDGIYVANQIDGASFADPSFVAKTKSAVDFVKTRITYNGGGAWQALDAGDEDLAVTDLAGAGSPDHGVDHGVDTAVGGEHLELDLRDELDRVLGPAIDLGVSALAAVAAHLGDGQPRDARGLQGGLDLVELVGLDDGCDELHLVLLDPPPGPDEGEPPAAGATGRACRGEVSHP